MEFKPQYEIYQHYKGGLYVKLMECYHSETHEEMVVYTSATGGDAWCRPKVMFEETVTKEGKTFPRFKKIEKSDYPEMLEKLNKKHG